jgi:cytochrome oxidase assembly protein ShyY1
MATDYRFLAKPRWIAFHLLVVVLIITMVNLAFWQLRRLHERRHENSRVTAAQAAPPGDVDVLVPAGMALTSASAVEWRNVVATGTYDPAHEVLVRNRSFQEQAGYHVITPLKLADGSAILVNRGWIPLADKVGEQPTIPPPAQGSVQVLGRLRPTQTRGALGPTDPSTGTLTQVARVDINRLQQQDPYPLRAAYVELVEQRPALTGDLPALVEPPALDDGPHLSYAIQWFLFSGCAVVGWVLVVRKSAKERAKAAAEAAAGDRDGETGVADDGAALAVGAPAAVSAPGRPAREGRPPAGDAGGAPGPSGTPAP